MSNFYKEETKIIQKMNSSDEYESKSADEAAEVQPPIATDAEDPFVSSEEKQEEDRTVSIFCCKSPSLDGNHEAETRPDKEGINLIHLKYFTKVK